MRKVIVNLSLTLDGVMQAPAGNAYDAIMTRVE